MADLNKTFDKDRRDLTIRDILPSAEEVYATASKGNFPSRNHGI